MLLDYFPIFCKIAKRQRSFRKAIENQYLPLVFNFSCLMGLVVLLHILYTLFLSTLNGNRQFFLFLFCNKRALSSIFNAFNKCIKRNRKIKITFILWFLDSFYMGNHPLAIMMFGFNGVSYASAFIALSVVFVIFISKDL